MTPRRDLPRTAAAAAVFCAALFACGSESLPPSAYALEGRQAAVAALFSPQGGIAQAIETEILAARRSVDVFAYLFTSRRIADALAAAVRKGVAVRVVLDAQQAADVNTEGEFLAAAGAVVYTDAAHSSAHSKYVVVDRAVVITGSYNLTVAAEETNAEDAVVVKGSEALAADFTANFDSHLTHCAKIAR